MRQMPFAPTYCHWLNAVPWAYLHAFICSAGLVLIVNADVQQSWCRRASDKDQAPPKQIGGSS